MFRGKGNAPYIYCKICGIIEKRRKQSRRKYMEISRCEMSEVWSLIKVVLFFLPDSRLSHWIPSFLIKFFIASTALEKNPKSLPVVWPDFSLIRHWKFSVLCRGAWWRWACREQQREPGGSGRTEWCQRRTWLCTYWMLWSVWNHILAPEGK